MPVVLQVVPSLISGGAERGCVDVAIAIRQAGATSLVASEGGPMAHELERSGVTHLQLPLASKNPFTIRRNGARIADIIKQYGVDIVHARSRAPAWSAAAAARQTGAHFITTFHAAYSFSGEWKRRYNSVMATGERVIAISEFIAEHIRDNYEVDPGRIRVIQRGIDMKKFDPARVSHARIAALFRNWSAPPDLPIVMLPGRLTRIKGHSVLIEALATRGKRDLFCVLVGSWDGKESYHRELKELIERRGLGDMVKIVGNCSDMPTAYRVANVVVSPSLVPEGFGRVPVEAQAMGRFVVASNVGGTRETVLDGETGRLVPPGDVNALAAALDEALHRARAERHAAVQRAIAHVAENFSKERMCAQTLDVYEEVLSAAAASRLSA
jgi:glycosyltransferase involved in cell wall biosynthesis